MDSVRTYSFRLGWGDCPSGCTSAEIWTYKVDNFCNVTLLSVSEGGSDPYPRPSNCYAKLSIPQAIEPLSIDAYPNPVNDVLHLSITGENTPCFYNLTDMYGRTVSSGSTDNNTPVNVSQLPAGVYVLQINNNEGGLYYQKIVKE